MIYLNYATYTSGSMATFVSAMSYSPIKFLEFVNVDAITGRDLANNEYINVRSRRNEYLLELSANDLASPEKYNFLKEFYQSDIKKICNVLLTDWQQSGTEVMIKDIGTIETEFINNNKNLPKIQVNLIDKYKKI